MSRGVGLTILNYLGQDVNHEPLNYVAAFFLMIDEVSMKELKAFVDSFHQGDDGTSGAAAEIVEIIKRKKM